MAVGGITKTEREELKAFLSQQGSIIHDLGDFGGRAKRRDIITNAVFFVAVILCFTAALFFKDFYYKLFFELGIMLISVKMAYFLYRFSKVAHFEFWALVALESKLDAIAKLVHSQDDDNAPDLPETPVVESP